MRTGPVAERIEEIRAHMLREQRDEITCDHARVHREELLGYVDVLARDLEDKADAYDTLLGEFDQQRELCADHSAELAKFGVAAEAAPKSLVHFTTRGLRGVCGADTRSVSGPLTLAWDEADDTIDCPACRMHIKGLQAGRGGAR